MTPAGPDVAFSQGKNQFPPPPPRVADIFVGNTGDDLFSVTFNQVNDEGSLSLYGLDMSDVSGISSRSSRCECRSRSQHEAEEGAEEHHNGMWVSFQWLIVLKVL